MKGLAAILFVLVLNLSFAQGRSIDFSSIDYRVLSINDTNPDSLAQKLVAPYTNDLQKVRAIFRWITENISYKTFRYKKVAFVKDLNHDFDDDTGVLKPLTRRVAENVLRKRKAVCNGYTRLFKAL